MIVRKTFKRTIGDSLNEHCNWAPKYRPTPPGERQCVHEYNVVYNVILMSIMLQQLLASLMLT